MAEQPRTALGSAHERFHDSLPERGRELRELCHALQAGPSDGRVIDLVWRRLLSLDAAAQVFQEEPLLGQIARAKAAWADARKSGAAPAEAALEAVIALCRTLGAPEPSPSVPPPDAERLAALLRTERWSSPSLRAVVPEGEEPRDAAVSVARTVAGVTSPRELLAALVIASPEIEREVRAALPPEQCELTSTAEPETALVVIDQVAPDVVLVEADVLASGGEALARALRGGRAASVRAVVALVPEHASDVDALLTRSLADAALRAPLSRTGLVERLLRLSGRAPRSRALLDALEVGTVDEIARGVAEEVRRGIAESLRLGRGERIELGDKSELLAATWSAVSRIRAQLAQRAQGRLRFDDAPYEGGPAALALIGGVVIPALPAESEHLRGRRILLADDDPAVRWFFGELLREAGAIAIEAEDGGQALELARRFPPDLIISDILMPVIDGFVLCRELKHDLALCNVPVILLSWKEDFLQRVRQLDAGASGYLRKEAGSEQILSTIAEALRPRAELHALLDAGDEVQGRVETLGVAGLLRAVAEARPDARVSVRSAYSLFEVDLRGGAEIAVTRTASDGSFARGAQALRQLLGIETGRYAVAFAHGPLRGALAEPLDAVLRDCVEELGALLDAVSEPRLAQVGRIVLDEGVLGPWLASASVPVADSAARLRKGESPREVMLSSALSAHEIEQHLRLLARLGALLVVRGPNGEDLVDAARRARREEPGGLMHPEPDAPRISAERAPPPRTPLAEAHPALAAARPSNEVVAPPPDPPLREPSSMPPPPRGSMLASVLTLSALAAVGYLAVRLGEARAPQAREATPSPTPPTAQAQPATGSSATPATFVAPTAVDPTVETPGAPRVLPFIDRSRGVAVAEDQGLLVVELEGGGTAPTTVQVGGRKLGPTPVAVALPAGRHEVTLKRDSQTSFRYVLIDRERPGFSSFTSEPAVQRFLRSRRRSRRLEPMRERLEISTAAGLGLLLLLAPAQAQKIALNDPGDEGGEARAGTEHARGSYAGVKPGGDAPPGNTVAKPGAKPAEITWPGFQMLPDGSSRVFLQTTVPLDTQAAVLPDKVVIDLGNVRIVGTNRFALYTKFFNTPVTRVEIKQAHKRTTLELTLRAPAQPRISTERAQSGYCFVYVDFPPGDYLPKGAAPEARLPPPAPGGEPPSSLPPAPSALPSRASASADASMDAELPPSVAKPKAKAKAKASAKGSITIGH